MDVVNQLDEDLKAALKVRDEIRLTTLRLLKSSLKNQEIELGHDLTMQEALSVLQKEAKKRQDSITQYEKADRYDLAKEEKAELEVIEGYLPKQMDRSEVEKLVDQAIADTDAKSMADMGKVIAQVSEKTQGAADKSLIAQIAKDRLSQ